ncbi:hypothetical protein HOY82DRAFT_604375 [Tuber indicum]|nr:hypothetical protein HOY82DRAFT_604375 [Tuber indicum]
MDEDAMVDTPSPVHTVGAVALSHSNTNTGNFLTLEGQPPTIETQTRRLYQVNIGDNDLGVRFSAMEQHLMVVQNRHIEDTKELKALITTLTNQVVQLQSQHLLQKPSTIHQATLPPSSTRQTWDQKATRAAPAKLSTTLQSERTASALLSVNTAIKKQLISTLEFTPNHHVLLVTKDNTPASTVLKNHRFAIEEAIRATVLATNGLRKDEVWQKVIIHGIPTTSTLSTVQAEIETFNPGTHLPCPPRWLTTPAQRKDKAASAMVLTIAGKDVTVKALTIGLSLLGRKVKVQNYLTF